MEWDYEIEKAAVNKLIERWNLESKRYYCIEDPESVNESIE